ncbi:MAG: DUF3046 domain-containing protein [Micromonosporaceae bacterium]
MRLSDFWARMAEAFGPDYAPSVARDQVIAQLGGRTVIEALDAGEPTIDVWRAVVAAFPDRIPAKLR